MVSQGSGRGMRQRGMGAYSSRADDGRHVGATAAAWAQRRAALGDTIGTRALATRELRGAGTASRRAALGMVVGSSGGGTAGRWSCACIDASLARPHM